MSRFKYENPIDKFNELSRRAENQKSERDKLKGAIGQISDSLKRKGFKSIKDAIEFKNRKIKERIRKKAIFDRKLEELVKKYDQYL